MGKLNSAYADAYVNTTGTQDQKRQAGANALVDTVTQLTGLTIDHYIQVDLLGFYRISNAIGGVPVNLCRAVDDTVAYNKSIGSDGGSGLKLSKGKHVLKGVQALEFVRQRHNLPNGDLDRVRRQQYFLTAAFRQVASVGVLFKLRSVGDAITQLDVHRQEPEPARPRPAAGEPDREQHRRQDDPHDAGHDSATARACCSSTRPR